MTKEDFIELVDHDIGNSLQNHNEQIEKVSEWIDAYDGEPYGNEDPSRSQMVWKIIKKQGESLISNLAKPFLGAHEIVELSPLTYRDVFKTPIYSKVINHFWTKDFNSNKFIKATSRLMVKEGTAFIRVGWEKQVVEHSEEVSDLPEQVKQKFIDKGATIEKLSNGKIKITTKKILKNRPIAKPIRLEDAYVDPTADTFEDSEFFGYEYTTNLTEISNNPLYDEEAVKKLTRILESQDDRPVNRYEDSHEYNPYNAQFEDDPRKKVRLIEYWGEYDIDDTGVAEPVVGVVARYGDDRVVLNLRKNKLPGGFKPFICIPLIEDDFNIYGNALAYMIDDEQKFSTSIVRGIIDNMSQSNNGQKFIKKNALDSTNFDRMMNGERIVEINTPENIATAVMDGSFNQLPSDVYNTLGMIEQQAESLTGVSKFMQGIAGTEMKSSSSNFATMMSQSQIRLLDMTTSLTNGLRQMFKMWAQMAMEYLSDDEIFDITGVYIPEAKVKETKRLMLEYQIEELPRDAAEEVMMLIIREVDDMFNMKDLKYDVKMKVGTDGLKDVKIAQINMLMQQAGNLIEMQVVPPKVMGMLFADMAEAMDRPDIAREVLEFKPQPPSQLEQEMAQAELDKKKAEGAKDMALAESAAARAENERAKTKAGAAALDSEIAKKYADVGKTMSDIEKNRAEVAEKLRGDSNGQSTNKG